MRVNAVAYFRVIDPNKAVTEVENFLLATSQIAQTTLRSVLGKAELDALLGERERLNIELQQIIDEQTEPWGVKVSTVEVKDVELPADMQRAIARQAEAERERRAKIISADGEFQAAEKLVPGRQHHQHQPGDPPAPVPADAARHRRQPELDDHLPAAARHDQAVHGLRQRGSRLDQPRPGGGEPGSPSKASQLAVSAPEVRIDQLTGLRAILAPGPGRAAGRVRPGPAGTPRRTPPRPAPSARAARTARRRRSGPAGRAAARPDSPGWTARAVPNLYPVLASARGSETARGRRQDRCRDGPGELDRPARRLDPGGRAGPVRLAARPRAPTR